MSDDDAPAVKDDYKARQAAAKDNLPDDDPTIDKWKMDAFQPEDNKVRPSVLRPLSSGRPTS